MRRMMPYPRGVLMSPCLTASLCVVVLLHFIRPGLLRLCNKDLWIFYRLVESSHLLRNSEFCSKFGFVHKNTPNLLRKVERML